MSCRQSGDRQRGTETTGGGRSVTENTGEPFIVPYRPAAVAGFRSTANDTARVRNDIVLAAGDCAGCLRATGSIGAGNNSSSCDGARRRAASSVEEARVTNVIFHFRSREEARVPCRAHPRGPRVVVVVVVRKRNSKARRNFLRFMGRTGGALLSNEARAKASQER